ncbi:formiminotetrahydrofolate cyclodeaminase [Halopolyspora algeriensis]|uniref:Formiminotetrahydrofolate cyclodeaminase n=1 Tax=Halopolyspora algeriensis TaxID=1500506 RepID=A0A368VQK3_9ACTN|nr:cyclodeaminase/cyclohydrolase family protein [Halopolyspora algeriensis]RCW43142.1 formiminotetrahydrofolate cyclodeaminase [Halopolyspora algeriensis]TQM56200.1 formiminotetrahydrofolate cyclodeaminase [Halopolyspora algeriensis]
MSILDTSVRDFLAEVAAPTPSATGGGVGAVTTAAAAGLVAMVARLSTSLQDSAELAAQAEGLRERAMELATADADSYAAVLAAQRRPREDPDRAEALREALAAAARPPFRLALLASEIADLAADLAERGKPVLRGDAVTATTLAAAAARSSAVLVRTNLTAAGHSLEHADSADAAAAAAQRSSATDTTAMGSSSEAGTSSR